MSHFEVLKACCRVALLGMAAAAVLAFLCFPSAAQVIYRTVVGMVADQTGAAVPGVNVKITSLATGEIRSVLAGSAGAYSIPNQPAGLYKVEVQQPGFKLFVKNNVVIQVDVTSRVDVALQIGDISETIEVTETTPLICPPTDTPYSIVTNKTINPLMLTSLR
jgi:hypothetical protein